MSYISNLKLLLRFKNTNLDEEVSTTTMFARGGSTFPQILDGGGYIMSDDQYLVGEGKGYGGYSIGVSNAMTLGFWLRPVNPGMAINPSTGDAESIRLPVLEFNEIGSTNVPVISISENTTESEENNLTVTIYGGTTYSASTQDYSPNVWHHFWIVYDGTDKLSIYVDGILQILQSPTGSLPGSIAGSLLDLYINHSLDGYAYNVAKNYGYISDIFVMNVLNTSESDRQRVINDGVKYMVDDIYTDTYIDKSSIYFNDPDTITVTSSIDDMSYVYLGRNDGKILRGSPLLWETRRTLASDKETSLFGLSTETKGSEDDDTWNVVKGFLELKNENIRL